ncbi:MAG: hypothetical protein H6706_14010 [Myxococcales bacterium]|nr:hypothetical protein [Myxococcales bacterium]
MKSAAWLVALAGCGEPLVPPAWRGEPVYIHPRFQIAGRADVPPTHPRWAVFWVRGGLAGSLADVDEQVGTSQPAEVSEGPLHLFAAPDPALLTEAPGGGRYGLARLLIYDDVDADGRRAPDTERVIALGHEALLYAPEPLDAAASPTGRALPAGYHRVALPLPCAPVPAGDATCDVPLGAPCDSRFRCGAGACWMQEAGGWPGGICVADAALACPPAGGARFEYDDIDPANPPLRAWLPACQTDADCRQAEGYACDLGVGGCRPDTGFTLTYSGRPPVGVCVDYADPADDAPMDRPGPRDGPNACEHTADCVDLCPAAARLGCACVSVPRGLGCVPRCTEDADCQGVPGPSDQICDGIVCRSETPGP